MHTKGPWKAIESWAYSHDGTQFEVMRVVDSDNSDVLAKVHEGPANARLIAAAPELLEALEGFVWAQDASDRNTGPRWNIQFLDEANTKAIEAIYKAKKK